MQDMRQMIREVLVEELARLRGTGLAQPQVTEETVSLRTDADLDGFVRHLVKLCEDAGKRADILAGRHRFRLGHAAPVAVPAAQPAVAQAVTPAAAPANTRTHFDKGMITERHINDLPAGVRTITGGKGVRLTPLARDEIRRRNIRFERTTT